MLAIGHAGCIQRATHYVITHSGKILYAASADQHNRVLLQVMTYAWDIGGYLDPVRQAHPGHLTKGRVGLLGRLGIDTGADAPALRTSLERRAGSLIIWRLPAFSNQLIECRHSSFLASSLRGRNPAAHTHARARFDPALRDWLRTRNHNSAQKAEILKLPIGDWVTTVTPSLNQEAIRFVFHNLHTLPGWKVAQIISARSCPANGWKFKILGQNHLQLSTYRQASVYSRNCMNITSASRLSQHRVQILSNLVRNIRHRTPIRV